MTHLDKAKRDIEVELERRTARIEQAVARLRHDFGNPGASLGRFARAHPYESLFGIVTVGVSVTLLLINRTRQSSSKSSDTADDLSDVYASAIATSMRRAKERGIKEDAALLAAIRDNPPVVIPPAKSTAPGHLRQMTDQFVHTVASIAFDYATRRLTELIDSRKSGK